MSLLLPLPCGAAPEHAGAPSFALPSFLRLCPRCPWRALRCHLSFESRGVPSASPRELRYRRKGWDGRMSQVCIPWAAAHGLLRGAHRGMLRVLRPWRCQAKPAGRVGVCSVTAPCRSSVPPSPRGQNTPGSDPYTQGLGNAEPGSAFSMVLLKITDNVQAPP